MGIKLPSSKSKYDSMSPSYNKNVHRTLNLIHEVQFICSKSGPVTGSNVDAIQADGLSVSLLFNIYFNET